MVYSASHEGIVLASAQRGYYRDPDVRFPRIANLEALPAVVRLQVLRRPLFYLRLLTRARKDMCQERPPSSDRSIS